MRFFHLGSAGLGHLVDDGRWQQFLFRAQQDQHLLVDHVDQTAIRAWRIPALAHQIHAGRRRKFVRGQGLFQLFWRISPWCGQAVNLKILEPHNFCLPFVSVVPGEHHSTLSTRECRQKRGLARCLLSMGNAATGRGTAPPGLAPAASRRPDRTRSRCARPAGGFSFQTARAAGNRGWRAGWRRRPPWRWAG